MDHLPEHPASPWHAGERALQERFNVAERLAVLGRQVIRDYMPEQHRAFFHQLPFMVVGIHRADHHERQLVKEIAVLLGHVVADDLPPEYGQAFGYVEAFLQRSLTGMPRRRGMFGPIIHD